MYRPVVLSYFSQSGDAENDYLKFLEDEYESIAEAWEQYQIQTGSDRYFDVDFPARGSADGDKVAEDIRNYKNRIILFHFSGHAMSKHLLFKDGASNARGLAGLLGEAQNLKLVVLNGCATYDQVKLLFDSNVKIVVATKGKISDGIAMEFANTFYRALSTRDYTIRGAFEHALNELKRKNSSLDALTTAPIIWRGLVTGAEEDRDRWELYVKEEKYESGAGPAGLVEDHLCDPDPERGGDRKYAPGKSHECADRAAVGARGSHHYLFRVFSGRFHAGLCRAGGYRFGVLFRQKPATV